jgi:predicted AlkP superfamily pyrophosphatase or phosphodiesterase
VTAGTLASLSNSVFASLGVTGVEDELGIGDSPARRECILLIDGMGSKLISQFGKEFPIFQQSIIEKELNSHFPTTTTVNLTSLATGVLPGVHGMLGYTVRVPRSGEPGRLLNALKWDERVDPVMWQKVPTLFERAAAQGISTSQVSAKRYEGTGFTRAALRGAKYIGANLISEISDEAARALAKESSFAYVYINNLDVAGHEDGVGSEKWMIALATVAKLLQDIQEKVPTGTRIWVTADHGMVNADEIIIFGQDNDLDKDVNLYGGEPRARHLYIREGALSEVKSRYQTYLGERAEVLTKAEALTKNLFGSEVSIDSNERIGDLIVIAKGGTILVDPSRVKQEAGMIGHHGGLSEVESLIPLLAY